MLSLAERESRESINFRPIMFTIRLCSSRFAIRAGRS